MKFLLLKSKKDKLITQAISNATKYLKDFNVSYTPVDIEFDASNPAFYEVKKTLAWFKTVELKSLSANVIYIMGMAKGAKDYDGIVLVVDKDQSLADRSLYGQHKTINNKHCIEVYNKKTRKKYWGMDYTTYNLIHETLHALCSRYKIKDTLHEYLDKNKTLDAFVETLKKQISPFQPTDLLPRVERTRQVFFMIAEKLGYNLRMTSGFRSKAEQDELYAQGRTKSGKIVTNARGGESTHNYGIAFDIVDRKRGYDLTEDEWKLLGDIGKKLGLSWGGDWWSFPDKPHFELLLDYKLSDFINNKVDYEKYK